MITREKDALPDPDALVAGWTGAGAATGTGAATDATDATDLGLLATLSSRLHCQAPMQPVDPEELSVRAPAHVDGGRATRLQKSPAATEVATYRCACGFTMDAPSLAVEYAVAS